MCANQQRCKILYLKLSVFKSLAYNLCLIVCQFCDGIVGKIKQLWPETVHVRAHPWHSESKGEDEQRLRTVEVNYFNWMNENNSTQ